MNNSVKNHPTITKFKLDLQIPLTYLHMQYQPYTYNQKTFENGNCKFHQEG
jgi:hypothetical protein